MKDPIYLDNNATTPLSAQVLEAMHAIALLPLNPSSVHTYGTRAKHLLKEARDQIARMLNVHPDAIFFTSGGTESLNTLIRGLYPGKGQILTSAVEHACVYETIRHLEKQHVPVSYLSVGHWGAPTLDLIERHLDESVSLMVFSAVYSETGVRIDLEAVAALAERYQIPLVIDGVALLGKEQFIIPPGVSGMGFSAHKLHGPKGVGALYLSPSAHMTPLLYGGHQEHNMRPGTEALQEIVGFARALQLATESFPQSTQHMLAVQQHFEATLKNQLTSVEINGTGPRICTTSNIAFHGIDGETLLLALDRLGIYASMGSACSSGAIEPSRVLLNMGLSKQHAKSSLRFSFSRFTTFEEINHALTLIIQLAKQEQQALSSFATV
jgi:cysteine desulfurase